MKRKTNITEIAKLAAVSPSTVSRALNNSSLIPLETRRRILELARQLEYRPHTTRSRLLALLLDLPGSAYTQQLLAAVQQSAFERKLRLELILPDALEELKNRLYYGVLLLSSWPEERLREWPETISLPLVRINGRSYPQHDIYAVASDDAGAVAEVMRRFRAAGHRRIGFLLAGSLVVYNNPRRLEAYRGECALHHQLTLEELVENPDAERVEAAFKRLLGKGITALLYLTPVTVNLQELLGRLRLRVPEELSLAVWEMLGLPENHRPPYLCATQDYRALAENAFNLLDRLAARQSLPTQVEVPYRWSEAPSISARKAY